MKNEGKWRQEVVTRKMPKFGAARTKKERKRRQGMKKKRTGNVKEEGTRKKERESYVRKRKQNG